MLNKRLAATTVLALALAVPSIVYGAGQAESAKTAAPAKATTQAQQAASATSATPTAANEAPKATMEENLAKFLSAPDSAVVAIVGDETITKGDLTKILWQWSAPQTLDRYINYRIAMQALKKEGLSVTDADMQPKLDEVKTRVPAGSTLEETLQRNLQTKAYLTDAIRLQLAMEKIAQKHTNVTDADYAEFIKARHILIRAVPMGSPGGSAPSSEEMAEADAAAKEKIDQCLVDIKAGKPFDEAAKEYSDDVMTKDKGGDLGWFAKNQVFQEVAQVAASLKAGEVSEPIKSYYGYHLVKVDKLGRDASPEEKEDLKARIMQTKLTGQINSIFVDIKNETKVDNKLAPALHPPAGR